MTAILWLAITLGGIVGFIVFITSDFATHQVVYFLARWKSLQFERAKLNELKLFALVNRLHAGKRDRYIFLTMSSQIVAVIAIFSVGIAVMVFVSLESTGILTKLISIKIGFAESVMVAFVELILSVVVFAFLFAFSVGLFKRKLSIQRKLSNYEEYRRDMIRRLGKGGSFKDRSRIVNACVHRQPVLLPKRKQSRWYPYVGRFVTLSADYMLDHRIERRYVGRFEFFGIEGVI